MTVTSNDGHSCCDMTCRDLLRFELTSEFEYLKRPLSETRVDSSGIGNADPRLWLYDLLSFQLTSGCPAAFDLPVGYFE